jgi:hypothetical protein
MQPPIGVWVYWSQRGNAHYISFIIHSINFFTITLVSDMVTSPRLSWPTASHSPCKEYYKYSLSQLLKVNVHLLPAGTLLFLYISQITLQAVMRRSMEQKTATSTVQLGLIVSWIDICLDVVTGLATNFHMNNVKLSLNTCYASYQIPELYIQTEHTLASCCYFKYLQLEKIRTYIPYIISYLLYVCMSQIVYRAVTHIGPLLKLGSEAQTSVGSSVEWSYSTIHNIWQKMSITCLEWIHEGCPQYGIQRVGKQRFPLTFIILVHRGHLIPQRTHAPYRVSCGHLNAPYTHVQAYNYSPTC